MPNNRSEESHRRTDGYILLTSFVGYFADAQYDVFFCFSRRRKRIIVFARKRSDEAISREGGGVWSICSALFRWDISLTLNMTCFFAFPEGGSVLLSLRGSEATKQSPGRVEVYGVYAPRFFGGSVAVCFCVAEYKTHKICKNLKKVVKQLIFLSKHYIMYTDN